MKLRVFATPAEIRAATPAGVAIVEEYDSFVLVEVADGDRAAREALRKRWPVEELDKPSTPAGRRGAAGRGRPAASKSPTLHHVISLAGPLREEWRGRLEKSGLRIVESRGRRDLVIEGAAEQVRRVRRFDFVVGSEAVQAPEMVMGTERKKSARRGERMLGRAAPAPAPAAPGRGTLSSQPPVYPNRLRVTFFTSSALRKALPAVRKSGIKLVEAPKTGETNLLVELPAGGRAAAVASLQALEGVKRISEPVVPRTRNDVAIGLMNGRALDEPPPRSLGLTGEGETIAVVDTGIDSGMKDLIHPDLAGRVIGMKSYPIHASLDRDVRNRRANDGPMDKNSGHGTHVAGSIAGDASSARSHGLPDVVRGLAYRARLYIQCVEQEVDWTPTYLRQYENRNGYFPERYMLAGIPPTSIRRLFADAYRAGARIQNNSWSAGLLGDYNEYCHDLDRFVWEHKDFCVLFAAGNSGTASGEGAAILGETLEPPGTAKNCITVGACENRRPDLRDTYGDFWPEEFPAAPIHDDRMADDPHHMAAFSSRGPTRDGRIKPDLVAPGTFILSLRSRFLARNQYAWGKYPACRDYFYMGGTSMATPLVTGAAALVRQHLRRKLRAVPSAALIKAALIHGARRLPRAAARLADFDQGWGLVDVAAAVTERPERRIRYLDVGRGLRTGQRHELEFEVRAGSPLRLTLAWSDFPGERVVNNLNLILRLPDGGYRLGNDFARAGAVDRVNNVESIQIEEPATGRYRVQVVASEIQEGTQDFALVYSGAVTGESKGRGWKAAAKR